MAPRAAGLEVLGAKEVLIDAPDLQGRVRERHPGGIDAVSDLVGRFTVLDSLAMTRRDGRGCLAGFLGGGGPIANPDPIYQIPGGRHFNVLASALVTGGDEFPLSEFPLQEIVDRVTQGEYKAAPARVLEFAEIREAQWLLESG